MRYALIENETKEVRNIIVWEGAEWLPPRGFIVVPSETANIGDIYDEATNTFAPKAQ